MTRFRYADFLSDLRRGARHGIFLDDTGSPGHRTTTLHPERRSWVAVIVPPSQMGEILDQFPGALRALSALVPGASEFHFADIYAGRREYGQVALPLRLAIFEFMAKIFVAYSLPVLVQTFDPISLHSLRKRGEFPDLVAGFDLRRPNDSALFFALLRAKWYLGSLEEKVAPARVFVDEGFKKNGTALHIPPFDDVFADGLICFACSSTVFPIQLADFAAFSLNRTQLLLERDTLSEIDKRFLEIVSPIAANYVNLQRVTGDLAQWSKPKGANI